jgi:Aerobic-type carbon monoxide dehydrogenase, small subunit CoxS/CutS homologs
VAIWAKGGATAGLQAPEPEGARWQDGALVIEGFDPLPLTRLAQEAHVRGLVTGAVVHGFNRWQWTEADFKLAGGSMRLPVDGLSLRYGDGASTQKVATTPNGYQLLSRQAVYFPPTRNNNAMVGYNTAVATLAEIAVDATNGKVSMLSHHTILECGNMLVPELVSGQIQGGVATGIGLALHEELPLYEEGRERQLELQSLPSAPRQRRRGLDAERRGPAAAVGQRAAQGNGRGGRDPGHGGHRERHRSCHRPSLPQPAGDARPDPGGGGMSLPTHPLTLTINGRRYGPIEVPEGMMMIDVLHEMLDLTGSRLGCGIGICHACVVIWDRDDKTSEEVRTCITGAGFFDGKRIRTIEGIAQTDDKGGIVALSPVQQAFLDRFSFQCGYCTPGSSMPPPCCSSG